MPVMNDGVKSGPSRRPFSWRAFTSVVILAAFLILLVSGLMLFVAPPGRIANWSNWTLWGLTKKEWTSLHIAFSALFLVVTVFHVIFNWRPLLSYFKDRLAGRLGFRWEWALAGLVCAAVWVGTHKEWQPFKALLAYNEEVKKRWETPQAGAPIPHAELLTLEELARQAKLEFAVVSNRLAQAGHRDFAAGDVLLELAGRVGQSPEQLYAIMTAETSGRGKGRQGGGGATGGGGGGVGWKTLAQFCADEGLTLEAAMQRLRAQNIQASTNQTLREIAVQNGMSRPSELLEILRGGGRP